MKGGSGRVCFLDSALVVAEFFFRRIVGFFCLFVFAFPLGKIAVGVCFGEIKSVAVGVHIGWLVVRAVIGCMWTVYATRVVPSTE